MRTILHKIKFTPVGLSANKSIARLFATEMSKRSAPMSSVQDELVGSNIQRRASIDIGSGATKLLIADVDVSSNRVVNMLFGEERTVSFSLKGQTANGQLSKLCFCMLLPTPLKKSGGPARRSL